MCSVRDGPILAVTLELPFYLAQFQFPLNSTNWYLLFSATLLQARDILDRKCVAVIHSTKYSLASFHMEFGGLTLILLSSQVTSWGCE